MKNRVTLILFLSFVLGFGQTKTVEKKVSHNKPVVSPVKVDANKEKNNIKGDAEVTPPKEVSDYSPIFTAVEVPASPPGGMDAYRKYISKSFKLPEVDETTNCTIVAKFVVWDDGSIRDIMIIKEEPRGLGLGKEYVRLLKESEKWTPGMVNGKVVKQFYTMPIAIQIQASDEDAKPNTEIVKQEIKKEDATSEHENSTEVDSKTEYNQIFMSVDVSAQPPGGMHAFRQYIGANFKLPSVYQTTIGTVVAKFVVWDDGSLRDIQIVKETPDNLGLGNEAIRVISSSDKWKPGIYNERNVKQYFTLPISIQITPADNSQPKKN
ncbi:MAG: hypothetical protein A3G95_03815 [Flavobacteria bacterium RIFCSPLOWO2_12_FULL_31_7]|nr:MAG: hypothetical protein A3G95_03815 [Flavobacteria bacterium RIFCSPLOWO2_12_FULL_31_7]